MCEPCSLLFFYTPQTVDSFPPGETARIFSNPWLMMWSISSGVSATDIEFDSRDLVILGTLINPVNDKLNLSYFQRWPIRGHFALNNFFDEFARAYITCNNYRTIFASLSKDVISPEIDIFWTPGDMAPYEGASLCEDRRNVVLKRETNLPPTAGLSNTKPSSSAESSKFSPHPQTQNVRPTSRNTIPPFIVYTYLFSRFPNEIIFNNRDSMLQSRDKYQIYRLKAALHTLCVFYCEFQRAH